MEMKNNDPTVDELKKIFKDYGLDFYIKKLKGPIVKVHIAVKDEK